MFSFSKSGTFGRYGSSSRMDGVGVTAESKLYYTLLIITLDN